MLGELFGFDRNRINKGIIIAIFNVASVANNFKISYFPYEIYYGDNELLFPTSKTKKLGIKNPTPIPKMFIIERNDVITVLLLEGNQFIDILAMALVKKGADMPNINYPKIWNQNEVLIIILRQLPITDITPPIKIP